MKSSETTEGKNTTWQRTQSWPKGLLRHRRTGFYYLRTNLAGKRTFESLKTSVFEIARVRAAERRTSVERVRKSARNITVGISTMGELMLAYRQKVGARTDIQERSKKILLDSAAYIEKTWPSGKDGFSRTRPIELTISVIESWKNHALANGTGFVPPGAKKASELVSGRSPRSFNKAFDIMRHLLDLAVDQSAIAGNPLAGRRKLKAKDRPRKPSLPEPAQLEKVFREMVRGGGRGVATSEFCRGLAYTGCRKAEAAAICWPDLDFARGIVKVQGTKTEAASREVPMIPAARSLFEQMRARREKISRSKTPVEEQEQPAREPVFRVREARISLSRACAAVGIPRLTHHDLRDAFATLCIESGVDVPTVAGWLGHADGGALLMRIYAHHRRAHSAVQAAKVMIPSS
ncbi:MAG: site-specific integrase [Burkholderiales bacterium]|nr:site-specific integrase [Opitutaceae bacterium]